MLKFIKRLTWFIAILIIIIVAAPLFIGWYLSPQDTLKKSDAIVVVSGGDNNKRIEKGVQLYKEGWAPVLMFSGAAAEGDVSNALAMKRIAIKKGVSAKDILIEEDSTTTVENAQFSAKILTDREYKSIILVTSPYHQRRTFQLFQKELPSVEILNQSAVDETWRKKGWWENGIGRLLTIGELGKIFINFVETKTGN